MQFPLNPQDATQAVIWGGLVLGLALGAIAQVSRFCTMGALADWFAYRGTSRLMMWALAVAVAAVGSLLLMQAGLLDATHTLAWSNRLLWLSYLVGGTLFGIGMVLASGCPQRNLVKLGSGSLKALVTLLVAGVTAQMTLRGVLSEVRVNLLDPTSILLAFPQDLGSILAHVLGLGAAALRWLVLAAALALSAPWWWKNRHSMDRQQWLAGGAIGLLVVVAWWLTGHVGYIPEHPETLETLWAGTYSHRPEAFTFAAPIAHSLDLLTLWSDRNTTLSYGVMVSLGTLLGSAVLALARKEFRIESFQNSRDMLNHLVGGALMGFGGITAMGCSIGQGVSGLSLLSAGACLAVSGIVFGTWLGLRFQTWQMERNTP
ncbi:YeeE/YedE family protein [Rhodoferax sp. PAMC 29310]|uniref:YeeE/YedE family protein n=1 Tax=Rhodoferax sp. PAMC 29310 TaxID=2822760 RepID=UPI001B337023|nr:YeeE/YedE family protein [Rhodoferax sp. PAMC 29310]